MDIRFVTGKLVCGRFYAILVICDLLVGVQYRATALNLCRPLRGVRASRLFAWFLGCGRALIVFEPKQSSRKHWL